MELTYVDESILRFLNDFRIARKKDLVVFTGNSKGVIRRRLINLRNYKEVSMREDHAYTLYKDDYSKEQQENILNVFDMIHFLIEAGVAGKNIRPARDPFCAAVQVKDKILLFTSVFPGEEKIQSKLIDLENHEDVVLVLQNEEQLKKMSMSKPIVKAFYLDDIRVKED